MSAFNDQTMRNMVHWATYFANDWKQEVPTRIHSSAISLDGSPEWHPDFARWLTSDRKPRPHNDQQRLRTTKVMRRLRKVAVREYEVAYRVLVLGERLEETTLWLNARAERNAIPFPPHRPNGPHYTHKDTLALLICAIDYAKESW